MIGYELMQGFSQFSLFIYYFGHAITVSMIWRSSSSIDLVVDEIKWPNMNLLSIESMKSISRNSEVKDVITNWLIWIGSRYPYQNVRDDMGSGLLKLVSNFTKFKLILSAEVKKERNSFQADHK